MLQNGDSLLTGAECRVTLKKVIIIILSYPRFQLFLLFSVRLSFFCSTFNAIVVSFLVFSSLLVFLLLVFLF